MYSHKHISTHTLGLDAAKYADIVSECCLDEDNQFVSMIFECSSWYHLFWVSSFYVPGHGSRLIFLIYGKSTTVQESSIGLLTITVMRDTCSKTTESRIKNEQKVVEHIQTQEKT